MLTRNANVLVPDRSRDMRGSMDTQTIIAIIKRRRDQFWDRQTVGSASDPDGGAAAQRARDFADEYDSLLAEIEGENPK
jgi:hypothetical protein